MSQFSQIVAATYDRVNNAKNKADNQWSENAFLRFLEAKGALSRVPGGPQLEFSLDTVVNPDAAFLATDVSPTAITKTEVLDAVKYDWALFIAPITWSILDEAKNSGEKKVDLVQSLVDNAGESHDDQFEAAMVASSNTNGMLTLQTILTEDGTGTIGGVNSGTDTYWANNFEDYGTDLNLGLHISMAETAKGSGGEAPDLLVTSPTTWATHADSLQSLFMITSNVKVDTGVKSMEFAGANMIFTYKYSSDTVFGINTKKLKLFAIKEYWRARRETIEHVSAPTLHMKTASVAQLATSNRSRNFCCFT